MKLTLAPLKSSVQMLSQSTKPGPAHFSRGDGTQVAELGVSAYLLGIPIGSSDQPLKTAPFPNTPGFLPVLSDKPLIWLFVTTIVKSL